MKFGTTKLQDAAGAILAHAIKLESVTFKKGRLLSREDVALLAESGFREIVAAKLAPDDVPEDTAAREIAMAISGELVTPQEAFTGRANLYANAKGLVRIDEGRLRALNHIHESLTVATLPNFARVEGRAMVATVKVIPFSVPKWVMEKATAIIGNAPLVKLATFKAKTVALIITRLPQTKDHLILKSEHAMRERVEFFGAKLAAVKVCDHTQNAVQSEIQTLSVDIVLVFGASAIVDRADVIPAALAAAGGVVQHMGMPVDPGNLLMLGILNNTPVIGVPTCARSPKTNGFDWVLARLMAGITVEPADLMDMGLGGLLAEISTRPSPREQRSTPPSAPTVSALVLAAGSSSRMGSNKLLADVNGLPMIAQTVKRIAASDVKNITVVTGHQAAEVRAALQGLDVEIIDNPQHAQGLSTSLRAGIAAMQAKCDAILVCLGDMPLIDPRDINRMIAAFSPADHRSIVVPVHERRFGNPVLWGAEHFAALRACEGDRGARGLLEKLKEDAVEISIENPGVILDADTPEALAIIRSIASS